MQEGFRGLPREDEVGRPVMNVKVVQLLECDPDLAEGLTSEENDRACRSLAVQKVELKKGAWGPNLGTDKAGHIGYLVCTGLLVRRVQVGKGSSVELLGHGDLLRPWQEDISSFCTSSWEVLQAAEVLHLGPQVATMLRDFPAVFANLVGRGLRRSRALAADAAVSSIVGLDGRLLILLWQLAERWGTTTEDGVRLEVHLPHRVLAELTGSRRPSVTTALTLLQESNRLATADDGTWLLVGQSPI